jgi:hypothetical protein
MAVLDYTLGGNYFCLVVAAPNARQKSPPPPLPLGLDGRISNMDKKGLDLEEGLVKKKIEHDNPNDPNLELAIHQDHDTVPPSVSSLLLSHSYTTDDMNNNNCNDSNIDQNNNDDSTILVDNDR